MRVRRVPDGWREALGAWTGILFNFCDSARTKELEQGRHNAQDSASGDRPPPRVTGLQVVCGIGERVSPLDWVRFAFLLRSACGDRGVRTNIVQDSQRDQAASAG